MNFLKQHTNGGAGLLGDGKWKVVFPLVRRVVGMSNELCRGWQLFEKWTLDWVGILLQ